MHCKAFNVILACSAPSGDFQNDGNKAHAADSSIPLAVPPSTGGTWDDTRWNKWGNTCI